MLFAYIYWFFFCGCLRQDSPLAAVEGPEFFIHHFRSFPIPWSASRTWSGERLITHSHPPVAAPAPLAQQLQLSPCFPGLRPHTSSIFPCWLSLILWNHQSVCLVGSGEGVGRWAMGRPRSEGLVPRWGPSSSPERGVSQQMPHRSSQSSRTACSPWTTQQRPLGGPVTRPPH